MNSNEEQEASNKVDPVCDGMKIRWSRVLNMNALETPACAKCNTLLFETVQESLTSGPLQCYGCMQMYCRSCAPTHHREQRCIARKEKRLYRERHLEEVTKAAKALCELADFSAKYSAFFDEMACSVAFQK